MSDDATLQDADNPPPASSAVNTTNVAALASLSANLESVQKQMEHLQAELRQKDKPWYRDAAVIVATISALAAVLSLIFSIVITDQQEKHNLRTELRGVLGRLSAISRESLAYAQPITGTVAANTTAVSTLQSENTLLAVQAFELMQRLEQENVSAIEYILVADALIKSFRFEQAIYVLRQAERAAANADDGAIVYRYQGLVLYMLNRPSEGASRFQAAREIFTRFPVASVAYQANVHAFTEYNWAAAEFASGNCEAARQHLEQASQQIRLLPVGQQPSLFVKQIEEAQTIAKGCITGTTQPATGK